MAALRGALVVVSASIVTCTPPTWAPLGTPFSHDRVVALSVAHNDGAPVIAYGASDAPDDTTTRFLAWGGSAWSLISSHTPQFAQPYEHFDLRVRNSALSLGLVINPSDGAAAGLSSILRNSTSAGSPDGWVGAYAFVGDVYDFDIAYDGSARVAVSPDNKTLVLMTYQATGWDTYPGGDTWTPLVTVETSPTGISSVAAERGISLAANETLYVTWTDGAGAVAVGSTPLYGASSAWSDLGAPFGATALLSGGAGPELATGPAGLVCVAALAAQPVGDVVVSCLREGVGGGWAPAAVVLQRAATGLSPGVAIETAADGSSRAVFAAASADGSAVLSAACALPASGVPACAPEQLASLPFFAGVNDFSLAAPAPVGTLAGAAVLGVSAGPADGSGDVLSVFVLA